MEEFKKTNKNLDLGECINESFEIYKKTALTSGLAFMVLIGIITILAFLGMVGFMGDIDNMAETMKGFKPETFDIKENLIYFAIMLAFSVLVAPFNAGLLRMMQQADQNEEIKFDTIFSYVNSKYFGQIVVFALILTTIGFGSNLVLSMILPKAIASLLGIVISVTVTTMTIIAMSLIIFQDLSAIEAVKKSINKVSVYFFLVLLLTILSQIMSFVGIFACCIGMFFTVPFHYAMQYVLFKKLG
jgi:amino acid transporter